MPVGFKGKYFDLTDRLGRILGVQAITSANGSLNDDGLLTGDPFWVHMYDGSAIWNVGPTISVSGNTLSWSWPVGTGANGRILYGVL